MRIGVLGTGIVGQTISTRLAEIGEDVAIGTRDAAALLSRTEPGRMSGLTFAEWHAQHPAVKLGTFAEAAAHGELLFNCTSGQAALAVLAAAGEANLNGKILLDVANPLDFSRGMPPTLTVCNTDSLAEQIQRAYPAVKVIKTLNTMTAALMVNPALVAGGDHHVFVSGNDAAAKAEAAGLLKRWFGWQHVLDLGDITSARGTEMYLPLWLRLFGALGTPMVNIKVAR